MSHDEVVRGGSGSPVGWLLLIGAAIAAALLSLLANHGKSSSSPPAPQPSPTLASLPSATPTAVPTAAPTAAPTPSLDPTQLVLQQAAGFVSAQEICPPRTNGRTTLDVSAVLRNPTPVTEQIRQLAPALPLAGLTARGVSTRSGSCAHPTGTVSPSVHRTLKQNATMLVTLHLGLPKTCPKPYPVELLVTLSINGDVRSEQLRLFNDLGSVAFATCPKSG